MSSVVRRSAAPLFAIALMLAMTNAGALAQDASPSPGATLFPLPSPARTAAPQSPFPDPLPSPAREERPSGPLAPEDPARCQLWQDQQAPAVVRARFAAVGGVGVSAAAVEAEQADPTCTLSRWDMGRAPGVLRDLIEDVTSGEGLHWRPDAADDMLTLTGEPFTGDPDTALDITGTAYGAFDLDRRGARDLIREVQRDAFTDEIILTSARPPEDWLERGRWQLVVLELAGDPTTPTETQRIWQLGFQARDPANAVGVPVPDGTPLAGIRNLLTYGQVAQEEGTLQRTIGRSDFGSNKVGPDGRSQYYNARPDAAVLEWPGGLAFLFPDAYDPVGFRPMAFHRGSAAWDFVVAPGGPMAFLPLGGEAAGAFSVLDFLLQHEAIDLPATIDGVASDGPIPFPSQIHWLFGSSIFDPTQPVLVDLAYTVDGHEVRFEDLVAAPHDAGIYTVPMGIPTYGRYELTGFELAQQGNPLPGAWDEYDEAVRSLGTGAWMIGELPGSLHGSGIPRAWWTGPGSEQLHPYDPELARQLLEEAGWWAVDP